MPEGDSLYRVAARLGPALEGRTVIELRLPHSAQRTEHLTGQKVMSVRSKGKNLLIEFEDGSVLHTHLRMNGRWRLVRGHRPLRANGQSLRVLLRVEDCAALCLDAPVVRLLARGAAFDDPRLRSLGPDLLGKTFDLEEALRRLRQLDALPLGDAIVDQRAVAGIGNIYKSELLYACHFDPFAPVARYSDDELRDLLTRARNLLRRNVTARPEPGGPDHTATAKLLGARFQRTTRSGVAPGTAAVAVYMRTGRPCGRCGTIVDMIRQGQLRRSTYFCPRCQPSRLARTPAMRTGTVGEPNRHTGEPTSDADWLADDPWPFE